VTLTRSPVPRGRSGDLGASRTVTSLTLNPAGTAGTDAARSSARRCDLP